MSRLQDVLLRGLAADRPAAGDVAAGTLYFSTDTAATEQSDGSTWNSYSGAASAGMNQLTGDVTAGPGSGSQATTIANSAVTNAKMANMIQARIKGRPDAAGTGVPVDLDADQVTTILEGASDPFIKASDIPPGTGITDLTGDVTASGPGSAAATIADDAVTYAKMQNISAASRLLGRGSAAGPGNTQEIQLGTNLALSGTTLNATDTGITELTGDVTAGPGSGSKAATLAPSGVTPGSYTYPAVTVDAKGRVTAIADGVDKGITALTGDVTASGNGSQPATLAASGVTPGSYINSSVTVDAKGRVTAIANGAISPGMTQLTGDVTAGPGAGSQAATLANSGVSAGAYGDATHIPQVTVDAKGRITAASQVALPANSYTEQVSTVTGTQNNLSLSAAFTYFKWAGASDATITGFTVGGLAPAAGSYVFIDNQSSSKKITLSNEGGTSTAANRFTFPEGADAIVGPGSRTLMFYDTTTSRWRAQVVNRPQWAQGPWVLDPLFGANVAKIVSPDTSGTFNDYNTTGFANCIMMEFEPAAATITLTGLIAPSPTAARICIIGNRDSGAGVLVLNHQDSGSSANNRFRLPGNANMTLAAGEYAWFYYDPAAGRWRMLVTAQSVGGITTTVINSSDNPYKVVTKNLTNADINGASVTPVLIVTGVANKIIMPVAVLMYQSLLSNNFNTSGTLGLIWRGFGTNLMQGSQINGPPNPNWRAGRWEGTTAERQGTGVTDPTGQDLVLVNSTPTTGGTGYTARLVVAYMLM